MSIQAAKDVTMGHRLSGKFTSAFYSSACLNTWFIKEYDKTNIICLLFRALGGSHGVPRVHLKGRQGNFYVKVCSL